MNLANAYFSVYFRWALAYEFKHFTDLCWSLCGFIFSQQSLKDLLYLTYCKFHNTCNRFCRALFNVIIHAVLFGLMLYIRPHSWSYDSPNDRRLTLKVMGIIYCIHIHQYRDSNHKEKTVARHATPILLRHFILNRPPDIKSHQIQQNEPSALRTNQVLFESTQYTYMHMLSYNFLML